LLSVVRSTGNFVATRSVPSKHGIDFKLAGKSPIGKPFSAQNAGIHRVPDAAAIWAEKSPVSPQKPGCLPLQWALGPGSTDRTIGQESRSLRSIISERRGRVAALGDVWSRGSTRNSLGDLCG
jgi:hypothetical protein